MVPAGLPDLADLRTGQIDHLPGDLAARRGDGGEHEADLGEPVARGVPGDVNRRRARDARPAVPQLAAGRPERRGGAGRTEQLDDGGPSAGGRSRSRCRASSASQTASLPPKVIGTACCPCVRPGMTVARCSSAARRARRRGQAERLDPVEPRGG